MTRENWDCLLYFFKGAIASEKWVEGLMQVARERRPPPKLPGGELNGVSVAVFDNLTIKCNYGSYFREDAGGIKLDMTTWFWTPIPRSLATPGFDAPSLWRSGPCGGLFRSDISLTAFCRKFLYSNPEVINNKRNRWRVFLLAAANGTLLSRPNYVAPWRPHKYYQKPIWGRLQSSYEDMREEVKTIRDNRSGQWYVFLVGDGLTLMRLNHLLKASPDVYLDSTPTCIPVQGEHPHGLFHALHCCLRLYSPFLRKLAKDVLENPSIKMEPNVSEFNVHRFFFLNMVTRAASEYLVELSRTPGADDLDDPIFILAKADANINLSWLTHFLYDAGFFILDFLQSVRGNESRNIDLLWRELFSYAHTDTAHKTQYVPMAIMRVFWGMALVSELDELYHNIRTVPTGGGVPGTNVGWDMAIEWLNWAIKQHVLYNITENQIDQFLENWPFMETVRNGLRDIIYKMRAKVHLHERNVDKDVERLKEFFRTKIGPDWATATAAKSVPSILKGGTRRPWVEVQAMMGRSGDAAPHVYIRNYVRDLTPFFSWQP